MPKSSKRRAAPTAGKPTTKRPRAEVHPIQVALAERVPDEPGIIVAPMGSGKPRVAGKFLDRIVPDMWDHQSLARGCLPLSSKRKEYSLAICGMSRQAFDRGRWLAFDRERWVRDHLPADIRAQQRACALERWRKAAYLLGVLTFWRRVTNAAGSKASCAALARVTKRARTA